MNRALTDAEARALGERWLAAGGGWRPWMRGIDTLPGEEGEAWRMIDADPPLFVRERGGVVRYGGLILRRIWPDLRDPATRGPCLEVVRERWGILVYLRPVADPHFAWVLYSAGLDRPVNPSVRGASEAEALVAALEAAPPRTPEGS